MTALATAKAKNARRVAATAETAEPAARKTPGLARDLNGIVHLLTCGSVDDGKSTLIGRLLWDATDLYDDQRATLENSDRRAADSDLPDFSLLLDGLDAEREQGITIDIAWRYFDTETRRLVIIDSPGHEQYTRNMASGASHADVAIMLVDARSGIKRQTRRHAAILDLVGVKRVILAVNKMDLVDWSEEVFRKIEADFRTLAWKFGFWEALAIPVCAVTGDNIATRSPKMPWYTGDYLLEHLEKLPSRGSNSGGALRFPVQTVLRDGRDFRGLAGTVTSGTVKVGDAVVDALSGRAARIERIATMNGDLPLAIAGQSVALQLDADIDVARGAVLSAPDSRPVAAQIVEGRLVWLSEMPYDPSASYLFRTATDLIPISKLEIQSLLELETLTTRASITCSANDIAIARVVLGRAAALDLFNEFSGTGNFMIVDALTGASVAGGTVSALHAKVDKPDGNQFVLTRELLARGLCRDLGNSPEEREEFTRRANETALLLRAAGVAVVIEQPPPAEDDMDPGL
jgi:bifunctional enzyme CysN/CysC